MTPMIHCYGLNGKPVAECPAESSRLCTSSAEGVTLRGDDTGAFLLHVYCAKGHIWADANPVTLLDNVKKAGLPLNLSQHAIGQMLTLGLVPLPESIFKEIMVLGIGDRMHFKMNKDTWSRAHHVDFPYFQERSREDQSPNPKRLLDLLCSAVKHSLGVNPSGTLMLSSGKDSTAIALGLAILGYRDVECLTFVSAGGPNESEYARNLCRKLGLKHRSTEIPDKQRINADRLNRFFKNCPYPCADDCQIPYATMALQHDVGPSVIDGSGNDVYMGHVPSRNDRWRMRLRVRSRLTAKILEPIIPYATLFDQFLRDPAELCLMQGMFRPREVARIYPASDFSSRFREPALEVWRKRDIFDFRAYVRGRHYDQGSSALKVFSACQASGLQPLLPWCDPEIVAYYFHLPKKHRFDEGTFTNKLLLREMLRSEIDYPGRYLGKKYFHFDRIPFFMNNAKRVKEEILGCPLWNSSASEALLEDAYRRLPRNSRVGVALNTWFLLSGWLNHNRWLSLS